MGRIKTTASCFVTFGKWLWILSVCSIFACCIFSGYWINGMGDNSTYYEVQSWMSGHQLATRVFGWICGGLLLGIVMCATGGIIYLSTWTIKKISGMFIVHHDQTANK